MQLDVTPAVAQRVAGLRDFCRRQLAPAAVAYEHDQALPDELIAALGGLGCLGVNIPARYGGAEAGPLAMSLVVSELAAISPSVAVTVSVTNMVAEIIARFGTEAQRQRYLPALCAGRVFAGAFALSEAAAGSDPGAMRCRATRDGDGWVLAGEKMWITSGHKAGVIVAWARSGGPGTRGISTFLVPGGAAGLSASHGEDKLGLRASKTVALTFDDCRLPADALLGEPERGFSVAMAALDGGRIGIASQAVGILRGLRDACAAALGPGAADQGRAFLLADLETLYESARLMTLRAAALKQAGTPRYSREAAMAKYYATEAANRGATLARDLVGLAGLVADSPVERLLRDARVTTIYEGTSQVQKMVIARAELER